jgi:hypothetical protein
MPYKGIGCARFGNLSKWATGGPDRLSKDRQVQVLEPEGKGRILGAQDTLDTPTLLPGLAIPVAEIFAEDQ